MSEPKLISATAENIESGMTFTYKGDFNNLVAHQLAYDAQSRILTDATAPECPWLVDRFKDDQPDSAEWLRQRKAHPRQTPAGCWSPGFRIYNHKYGFIIVLFSECFLKEVPGV